MAHDDKNEEVLTGKNLDDETEQTYPILYEPQGFSPVYSDNAVVMHTDDEFILSFYLSDHLYSPGTTIDRKTGRVQIPGDARKIKLRCVSRVIMSPNQMIKLANVLQDNVARYLNKAEQAKEAEEGEGR